jgi:hypothetical protein
MKFNKESRILAAVALMCITSFLFSFTKKEKEEVGGRYQIERVYKDGVTFYVLVDMNGNPIHFMYR